MVLVILSDMCRVGIKSTLAVPLVLSLLVAPALAFSPPYGDPPDERHPWAVHDYNRPQPPVVEPGATIAQPPSDAIVLFDGSKASMANWKHVKPFKKRRGSWVVEDRELRCVPGAGNLATKEEFGDCQLHLEWAAPLKMKGSGQSRGNSGVFLMGMIEVQVLDNYDNTTYPDGSAGAIYGVMPPAVNALRPPTEWQSYDIIFRRPVSKDGVVVDEGSMTVLINGVVVQDSVPLDGGGGYKKRRAPSRIFPDRGSLLLQDHKNLVRYRNIWYRPLRPRAVDGGFDGRISAEATAAKRAKIAAEVRADAASMIGVRKMLRLLESLRYEYQQEAMVEADRLMQAYLGDLSKMEDSELSGRRSEVTNVFGCVDYLWKFELIPSDYAARLELKAIMVEQGWKKK